MNAINGGNEVFSTTAVLIPTSETVIATVSISSSDVAGIELFAQVTCNPANTQKISFLIHKDSLTGPVLSYGGAVPAGEMGALVARDTSPASGGQNYVLTAVAPSGTSYVTQIFFGAMQRNR